MILQIQDPNNAKERTPSSSDETSVDKTSDASDIAATSVGKTRDILEITEEFKRIVTQMASEKFDFHQWFR